MDRLAHVTHGSPQVLCHSRLAHQFGVAGAGNGELRLRAGKGGARARQPGFSLRNVRARYFADAEAIIAQTGADPDA